MSHPGNSMTVRVQVSISNDAYGPSASGRLDLQHEFRCKPMDFADIAALLNRYDALSKEIEKESQR